MTFAAFPLPFILALMGVVSALVIGVYLLRRTPRPIVVSNVDFWLKAAQKAKPRLLASLRIPLIALLVSLLCALAMVALIGDPRFGAGVRGTTVIVIDAGHSMGAEGRDGTRRIDQATLEVERWVERSTIAGEVAIVRAGVRPSVLLPLTEHGGDLDRALRGLVTDDAPSDIEAAVALADAIVIARSEAVRGASNSDGAIALGQILLVTDQTFEGAARAPVVTLPVGARTDTVGIVGFAARRVPEAVGEYAVRLEVENFSTHEARLRAHVVDGDVSLLDERVTLAPRERHALQAGGFSSRGAELHATLESITIEGSEDGFTHDDEGVALVPALDATRVLLVTAGDRYLEAALQSHPGLDVVVMTTAQLAAETTQSLARFHALVLHRTSLPAGVEHRAVLAFAPTASAQFGLDDALRAPLITGSLASHPALQSVRFDDVRVSQARAFAERPGDQVLVRSREHVLAFARQERRGRVIGFGFDTTGTDLVTREAFPLLVHDALRWTADRLERNPIPAPVGGTLVAEAGEDITGPDGETIATGELPVITQQGLYRIGDRAQAFSASRHAGPLSGRATGGRFLAASQLPPLAVIIALALIFVMLAEWALLHRGRLG
jgi:hypothetical protein